MVGAGGDAEPDRRIDTPGARQGAGAADVSGGLRFVRVSVALLATLAGAGCSSGAPRRPAGVASTEALMAPAGAAMNERAPDVFEVDFETSEGEFAVEVRRDWAPHGADRFYNLVRHGFFDGQRFFRVRAGYIAQFGLSGDPAVIAVWKGQRMPDDPVRESNRRGTLAYAMTGPDTRTTQIFINLAENTHLDAEGFAPFARVVRGMDVVDRLYAGYGESAGGGMRGGKQGKIEAGGNEYLRREFPELDYIRRAVLRVR